MLEAIQIAEEFCGEKLDYSLSEQNRSGDHIWWVSDVRRFKADYPGWSFRYDLHSIIREITEATQERHGQK